jgi:imidazolonepropionase-like amidohydrolase
VIDVRTGRHWSNRRVVIVGNRIRTIGPATRGHLAPGAQVVDARGKYLIPGL